MQVAFYLRLLRRWFWLIIINGVLFGAIGFIFIRLLPPVYEASTTVLIGSILTSLDPNVGVLNAGQQLAPNYVAFTKAYSILEATIDKLQLPMSPESLAQAFNTRVIPSTLMLQITVTYGDPLTVADIANELATQLITKSPTNFTQQQQQQVSMLQDQIDHVQTQLSSLNAQLTDLNTQLAQAPSDAQRQTIETLKREVGLQLNSAQTSLAQLTSSLTALQSQGSTNVLTIVERARVPNTPVDRNILFSTFGMALLGIMMATGLSILVEYISDTVRVPSDLPVGISLLGSIAPFGRKGSYTDKLIVMIQPHSTLAESYRALRVSLTHAAMVNGDDTHFTYIITSPGPGEGKSTTTANLAITFANTGLRVILIDADLRRPTQHKLFQLPSNASGLTNVLTGTTTDGTPLAMNKSPDGNENGLDDEQQTMHALIASVIQSTPVSGLDIIPSGPSSDNPAELLGTVQMQHLISTLHETMHYDVILIDTPPTLSVSDTRILAGVIDATLALVIEAARTRRSSTIYAVQQLNALSVTLAGVVLNRVNMRDAEASYGYYYGYYGYESHNQPAPEATLNNSQRPIPAIPASSQHKGDKEE